MSANWRRRSSKSAKGPSIRSERRGVLKLLPKPVSPQLRMSLSRKSRSCKQTLTDIFSDLMDVVDGSKAASHEEEADCVYDYFVFNMDELVYSDWQNQKFMADTPKSEHDSEDSNRESCEDHDYPEEDSDFDGNQEDEEAAA